MMSWENLQFVHMFLFQQSFCEIWISEIDLDSWDDGRLKAKKEIDFATSPNANDFSWNSSIPNLSTALPDSSLICIWELPRFWIVQVCAHRERQRNPVKLKHYSPQLVQVFFSTETCQCD